MSRSNTKFLILLTLFASMTIPMEEPKSTVKAMVQELEKSQRPVEPSEKLELISQEPKIKKYKPSAPALEKIKNLEANGEASFHKSVAALKRKFEETHHGLSTVIAVQDSQSFKPRWHMTHRTLSDTLDIAQKSFNLATTQCDEHWELLNNIEKNLVCDDTVNFTESRIEALYEKWEQQIDAQADAFFALTAIKYTIFHEKRKAWHKRADSAKTYGH